MSDHIQYDFLYDNHFAESKKTELTERIQSCSTLVTNHMLASTILMIILEEISTSKSDQEIIEQDKA